MSGREQQMWYCPECRQWVGWKREECGAGHSRPWRPVRFGDIEESHARHVSLSDRVRAKLRI
jgi:hypothetical protein